MSGVFCRPLRDSQPFLKQMQGINPLPIVCSSLRDDVGHTATIHPQDIQSAFARPRSIGAPHPRVLYEKTKKAPRLGSSSPGACQNREWELATFSFPSAGH